MKQRITTIKYRKREINLVDFIGSDFMEIEDVQISLLGRSRRSVLNYCRDNSIPVLVIKDGNTIICELINVSQFQQILMEQSQLSTQMIKPTQKKLPSMASNLFYHRKRRCLDFLKSNSFKSYVSSHLNSPEFFYRSFGLLINAMSYSEYNLQNNPTYDEFDLSGMSSKEKVLANVEERIENLVEFMTQLQLKDEPFVDFVSRILESKKLVANEEFLTVDEIVNHELIAEYWD